MPCLISALSTDTRFLKNKLKLLAFSFCFILPTFSLKTQILSNLHQLELKFNTTGAVETYQNYLNSYGCWCKISKEWITARGVGQDSIDQHCKNLLKGYRCAVLDTKKSFSSCDPFAAEYVSYDFNSFETIHGFCNENNSGSHCSIAVCILDANFALNLFEEFQNTGGLDEDLIHDTVGGDFNHRKVCQPGVFSHVITKQRQCCGEYPNRMPVSITTEDNTESLRWTCVEINGYFSPRYSDGSCELDSNQNCMFYSSAAECNKCRLGIAREYTNTIQIDFIHSHSVFGNPRFSVNNSDGENYWTSYGGGDLEPRWAIDGNILQEPSYKFAHVAKNTPEADFLLDLDGRTLINFVTIYPRQDCECRFIRYEHMIVFIENENEVEITCEPRFLYDESKMRELDVNHDPLFFDCGQDVVGFAVRVSNQQVYGNGQDNVQIVEIQLGYKN